MSLIFDPDRHAYALDGRVLPSVTQVLREVGLIDATWFTDEARDRGTYVHTMLALEHEGTLDDGHLDPALEPYLLAWRAFKSDLAVQVLSYEQPVCDPTLGYAGTYDMVVTTRELVAPLLIDVKSGRPEAWCQLQTAAYARVAKSPAMPVLRRGALWLRGDGTYQFTKHTDRTDEQIFLAALQVVQWRRAHGAT